MCPPVLDLPDDPAARQILLRQLDRHAIANQDPDEILPRPAADVRRDPVAALDLDAVQRARQRRDDNPFDDLTLAPRAAPGLRGAWSAFGHRRTAAPSS